MDVMVVVRELLFVIVELVLVFMVFGGVMLEIVKNACFFVLGFK